jgi:hypothetical protein
LRFALLFHTKYICLSQVQPTAWLTAWSDGQAALTGARGSDVGRVGVADRFATSSWLLIPRVLVSVFFYVLSSLSFLC